MRRPLFTVGFSLFAASFTAFLLPENLIVFAACIFLAVGAFSLPFLSKYKHSEVLQNLSAVLFSAAAGFFAVFLSSLIFISPLSSLVGQSVEISAYTTDEVSFEHDYTEIPAKAEIKLGQSSRTADFIIYCDEPINLEPYDSFVCTVNISGLSTGRSHSAFSPVILTGGCESLDVTGEVKKDLRYYSVLCRGKIAESVSSLFSDEISSLLCGISMSKTENIPTRVTSALKACSLSHLTSVSGLHVTLISGFAVLLLSKFKSKRLSAILSLAFIWGFVFLAGMRLSAIRAALMMTVLTLGKFVFRPADSCNSLGLACIIICLFIPFSANDKGFVCSVLATLGVVTCSKPIFAFLSKPFEKRGFGKRLLPIVNTASLTISSMVFSLPVLVYYFGGLSLVGVIANIAVTPFAAVCVIGCILGGALYAVPFLGFIGYPFMLCAAFVARYIIFITNLISKIPYAFVHANYSSIYIWLTVFYGALLYGFVRFRKRGLSAKSKTFITMAVCSALAVCCVCASAVESATYRVIINSSEKFDTVAVIHAGRAAIIGCDRRPDINRETLSDIGDLNADIIDFFVPLSDSPPLGAYFTVKNGRPKTVLLPQDREDLQRLLAPADVEFSFSNGSTKLFDNTYLTISGDMSSAVLDINGKRIFIGSGDFAKGNFDFTICGGSVTPKNGEPIKSGQVEIESVFNFTYVRSDTNWQK